MRSRFTIIEQKRIFDPSTKISQIIIDSNLHGYCKKSLKIREKNLQLPQHQHHLIRWDSQKHFKSWVKRVINTVKDFFIWM